MQHGDKSFEVTAPRSRFYQGGFGRLFPDLKPWAPDGVVGAQALEQAMLAIANEKMTATGGDQDSSLPSGYTYFGQFVDHDITLDTTPLSEAESDPNRLQNFRTPRLDLDCIYGQGPDAQPYLYEHVNGGLTGRLRVGTLSGFERPGGGVYHDLPRLSRLPNEDQTALIADPRNDENIIVAQLHLAFLLAHNALVDAQGDKSPTEAFAAARQTLRWLYQWLVWKDYVSRICDKVVFKHAIKKKADGGGLAVWEAGYKDVYNWKNSPFMPVEFSAAAYRFGHSLVRGGYRTNFFKGPAPADGFPTFSAGGNDLRGGSALDGQRVLQWDWFLKMQSSQGDFPQLARKFDTKLASALQHLPGAPHQGGAGQINNIMGVLAARNLVRGVRMQLPAGSAVAKNLGLEPIDLDGGPDALWFYILKEAEIGPAKGNHLGTVGSVIVAATFAGLLLGDPLSHFNIEPNWEPDRDKLLSKLNLENRLTKDEGKWSLASIIRLSGLPVAFDEFPPRP
ncbi:peroxidase family protein [Devosia sp. SL43]|uniref:peroxidase family protein n=1 Tax=Devosia sp. SL43 TaxID=2806348 RepID=UPI001F3440D6|nr:heme peroxidase family protein [Devosia sp. SL43]UJW86558.1 peroxidase [Devosia sp. SL43]